MTQHVDVAPPTLAVPSWTVPITVRITAAMTVIIMAAVLLTSYLNYVKFHHNLTNLAASRFTFVLTNLGSSIESSASIGLPLSAVRNIQDLIDREKARDEAILLIEVADEKGNVVYATERHRFGAGLTAPVTTPNGRGVVSATDDTSVTLGASILNSFDRKIGSVILRYSTADTEAKAEKVLHQLVVRSLLSAAAALFVGLTGFYLVLRIFRRSVERMSRAIEALLSGKAAPTTGTQPQSEIERQFERFYDFLAREMHAVSASYTALGTGAIDAFFAEHVPKFTAVLQRSLSPGLTREQRVLRYQRARRALADHLVQFEPALDSSTIELFHSALDRAVEEVELERQNRPKSDAPGAAREQIGLKIVYRLFGLTIFALMVPLALVSVFAVTAFRDTLVPEMHQKGAALADAVAGDVSRALDLGIPLAQLAGAADYLGTLLPLVPEARFIAITGPEGRILHSGGLTTDAVARVLAQAKPGEVPGEAANTRRDYTATETPDYFAISVPIGSAAAKLGSVHVGISQDVLRQQQEDLVSDVGVLSLAGLLITFEVLLIVVALAISHPLTLLSRIMAEVMSGRFNTQVSRTGHTEIGRLLRLIDVAMARIRQRVGVAAYSLKDLRASNLVFMRTPLFLFCFAEEFARSFFPIYVKGFALDIPGLPTTTLVGLPITCFMIVVAIATPIAAVQSDRIGRRPIFLTGAAISSAALLLTALATSFWLLLAYRVMAAVGYAMVFISSQGYVFDNTLPQERTQGISVYVGAITAADLCGPPIGGIIADQLGFRLSFAVAAGIALLATLLAAAIMHDVSERRVDRAPQLGRFWQLLRNGRFVATVILASVPAKLLLTGFLFFLVPLYLNGLGESQSSIGRVIMAYAIGNIVLGPLVAKASDRWGLGAHCVVLGGIVSGASLASVFFQPGLLGILIGVAGLGVGQAISISPQLGLVLSVAAREVEAFGSTTVISVYRICERIGAALGPVVVGALLLRYDVPSTIFLLGAGSLIAIVALVPVLLTRRRSLEGDLP